MRHQLSSPRRLLPQLVALAVLLLGISGWAQAQEGKVYLLITASDADRKIGRSCLVDLVNVRRFFGASIEGNNRVIETLTDKDETTTLPGNPKLSLEAIENYYHSLNGRVTAKDTVVFYYSGHGAFDSEQYHYMATKTGPVPRFKVRDAIWAMDPRPKLIVIITDCCSAYMDIQEGAKRKAPNADRGFHRLLKYLMFA